MATRRIAIAVAIGFAASLVALAVARTDLASRFENSSYDWRVRYTATPASSSSPIVLIEINESTIRELEPLIGRWPWPRAVHAAAIDYIAGAGAKTIAYDVFFGERESRSETTINGQRVSGAESDRALVESVRRAGSVVLLADATYEGLASGADGRASTPIALPGIPYHAGAGFLPRPLLEPPFDDLAMAARGIGHNYLIREGGSDAARRMLPFVAVGDRAVPSLGVAAALAFNTTPADQVRESGETLQIGTTRLPLLSDPSADGQSSRQVLLRFKAPSPRGDGTRSVFPAYSFFDVLLSSDKAAAGQTPPIPPSVFKDKLVFVGTSAAGLFDRFSTPFAGGAPGIELHATMADNILVPETMRRASMGTDVTVVVASAVTASLLAVLLPVIGATSAALMFALAGGAWLTHEVGNGLWLAMVAPALAGGLALFGGVAWQYLVEGREKRRIRALFGRYVSKDVIAQLMADPALAELGGQRREMTVLFSDIRGFTAATERGAPEAVVAQLNEYFGEMVEVLFRHQGTLDKFVGDMVMGLFGAPLADPAHADHAVAAALDMSRTLDRLNVKWAAEGKPTVDIGIGINSGEMIAGNIGSRAIMSYTVIGDAVNLGSRIESLNKNYGTRILISEATRARLTMPVMTRQIGEVTVKGRVEPVIIYEVQKEQKS